MTFPFRINAFYDLLSFTVYKCICDILFQSREGFKMCMIVGGIARIAKPRLRPGAAPAPQEAEPSLAGTGHALPPSGLPRAPRTQVLPGGEGRGPWQRLKQPEQVLALQRDTASRRRKPRRGHVQKNRKKV